MVEGIKNKEKYYPKFANFGEYLFWSYANLQMLCAALNILVHYLKNIYLYSIDNGLMDKHAEELDSMELPFKWQYIPLDYPQPEFYI